MRFQYATKLLPKLEGYMASTLNSNGYSRNQLQDIMMFIYHWARAHPGTKIAVYTENFKRLFKDAGVSII